MFLYRDDEMELQLLEPRHAAEMFAVVERNRASLRDWLGWVDDTRTPGDIRTFIQGALRDFAEGRSAGTFGIVCDGRFVGTVGYNYANLHVRRTEIGYWLGAEARGKGLMTRASRILVDHAFNELHFNKVEIHCAVGNTRSRAIPERLQFREEGTIRQAEWLYDHFVDHVVYGILASEWKARGVEEGGSSSPAPA